MFYSASNYLHISCCCFCCWVLVSFHCDQIECRRLFLFSYLSWGLLCVLRYDLFWRKLHGLLRRMGVMLLSDAIFCIQYLGPFDLSSFSSQISLLIFCLNDLSISDIGILKYPSTTVLESICAFKSFSVCLMKLDELTLGASRLIIVISFWCIAPFVSMKCHSLSCLTNVSLKSTLSDMSIATPDCFGGPLAW
jgi:hypothetical protein